MVDHRLKVRWLDNILRIFRPSDMQVFWSSEIHLIRPPADCVHVPHHLSQVAKSQSLHRRWKFVFPFAVARSVDSSSLTAFPRPMCSVLLRLLCSRLPAMKAGRIHWHVLDSQWPHRVSNLRHRRRFKIYSGVVCEKGLSHQLRAGVERARIAAQHCIHPSGGLGYDWLCWPFVMSWHFSCEASLCCLDDIDGQHCASGACDWSWNCEMAVIPWLVYHFSVAGLPLEIFPRREEHAIVD